MVRRYWWEAFARWPCPKENHARGSRQLSSAGSPAGSYSFHCVECLSSFTGRGMRDRDGAAALPKTAGAPGRRARAPESSEIHPLIVRFLSEPRHFPVRVKSTAHLPANSVGRDHAPARSRSVCRNRIRGRRANFRVFRRRTAPCTFLRELYMADTLRVFDSVLCRAHRKRRACTVRVFVDSTSK